MRKSIILTFTMLCMSIVFLTAQTNVPELHFTWGNKSYPVYQVTINKLVFSVKNATEAYKTQLENKITSSELVKSQNITKNASNFSFDIQMQNDLTIGSLKQFLTNIGVTEFYFNNKKVYTVDILNMGEIAIKNTEMSQVTFSAQITPTSSETEKADFQIYNAKMKLSSFYNDNYCQYLFNGSVADLKDKIRVYTETRNNLNK